MDDLTLISLIVSFVVAIISLVFHYFSYRDFSGRTGWTIILATFFIVVWVGLDFYLLQFVESNSEALFLSSISASFLTTALYLTHYFYDEISATYRQRKTMTLGSITFGLILGMSWIDGNIEVELDKGVLVNPFLVLLIILQGGLLAHRVTKHLKFQGKLSRHYGISSIFNDRNRLRVIIPLVSIFLIAILVFVLSDFSPYSTPFYVLVVAGYLFISVIASRDPLSSMPIAQALEAIALVSEKEETENFSYIFATESTIDKNNFGHFVNGISQLLREIIKSETRIVSFNSADLVVMFEPIGQKTLILILKKRNPGIRRLLRKTAMSFTQRAPTSNTEFVARVKKSLKIPEGAGKYQISDFTIVFNHRSATYKKARKKWKHMLETNTTVLVDDFDENYIAEHNPEAAIVLGGDGTVHSVATAILKSSKPIKIGILPGGGGNDIYERWYNRELEFFDADGFGSHPVFKIEYQQADVEYATNTIEWGIGAIVAEKRENNEGRLFLGISKYFYLLLKALRLYNSWGSKVIIDGEEFYYEDLSAVVVGFGASTMGGGFEMFPEEMDGNNKRDAFVLIARGFGRRNGMSLILKLARSKQFDDDRVIYRRFSTLELLPDDVEALPITIDGELRPKPPITISVDNKMIKSIRQG